MAPLRTLGGQFVERAEPQAAGKGQHHYLAGDAPRRHRLQGGVAVVEVGQRAEHRGRAQRTRRHLGQGVLGDRQRGAGGTRHAHAAAGDEVQRHSRHAALRHPGEHVQVAAGTQPRRSMLGRRGGRRQQHDVVEPVTGQPAQLAVSRTRWPVSRARRQVSRARWQQVRHRQPERGRPFSERGEPPLGQIGHDDRARRLRQREGQQHVHLSHGTGATHEPRAPAGRQLLPDCARIGARDAPVA